MQEFSFATTARMTVGQPVADVLRAYCARQRLSNVMIVTDAGIQAAGLLGSTLTELQNQGIEVVVFDAVEPDPSSATVLSAIDLAKSANAQVIIGFGGGSSMDVAKLVALLSHPDNQQSLDAVFGVDQARGQRLNLVQVPTTAGTGSEVTPIAIVTTGGTTKAGVVSDRLQPDLAILDPDLTLGLPPHITAATGIDAMVHAIEAYTSKIRKNPYSDMLARQALQILSHNIHTAVTEGSNREARANMLLGAMLAGQAFANAPVAGVHALAYPLGGHFHISHGLSNALVLPHVLKFNHSHAMALYAELAPLLCSSITSDVPQAEASMALIDYCANISSELGLPERLRDCNVPKEFLPQLAEDAMLQQRLLVNNPRTITRDDAFKIYQEAF
ncbi:iron-containing alcohol dehydrogenase [Alteromonas flava]|uniref:iron-containing alcohol dehydrogenase n=1 Tax=Alteromonas flava TaxID=2048003 RepID=UPI000C28FCA6|nr:iron-containing alcohol dehydrogenase [Alteromonas flava]